MFFFGFLDGLFFRARLLDLLILFLFVFFVVGEERMLNAPLKIADELIELDVRGGLKDVLLNQRIVVFLQPSDQRFRLPANLLPRPKLASV